MADEVTNETPLLNRAQHTTLADAHQVLEHLADQARLDVAAGRAPEGAPEMMDDIAFKVGGLVMMLDLCGMVSDE